MTTGVLLYAEALRVIGKLDGMGSKKPGWSSLFSLRRKIKANKQDKGGSKIAEYSGNIRNTKRKMSPDKV